MAWSHRGRRLARHLVVLALSAVFAMSGVTTGTYVDSAVVGAPSASHPHAAPAVRQGPFAIVLVIDAARFDEINLTQMPNLARLVAGGTQYANAWVGQLPTITETSHATIGTGVFPSRHLVLGETWRVPGKNQMAPNLLDGKLDRTGYIGHFIRQTGVPTLATAVHRKFPGSIVVSLSGHKIYAADALGAGSADFVAFGGLDQRGHYVPGAIPGHAPAQAILASPQLDLPGYPRQPGVEDAWTTTLALKFLFKYHPRLMLVNFPEVDVFGHVSGTNASVMQPLMKNIDHQIGRLVAAYGRAGMLEQTYFVITSDHAMVPAVHTVGSNLVQKVVTQAGGQPLYIGHGDYSPIWLKNVPATPRVAASLGTASIPNVAAVYAKNPGGRYVLSSPTSRLADPSVEQAYSDLLSTFACPESPDLALIYDENTITMTPHLQQIARKGDHGGATWGSQHIPLILAGPGVKQAYTSQYPARLVDIAPTVETLLGIEPQHQDGTPLADAMVNPPGWATAAQAKQGRLATDVAALEREAAARPNARR